MRPSRTCSYDLAAAQPQQRARLTDLVQKRRGGGGGQLPGLIRLRSRMSPGRSTPAGDYDAVATTVPTPATEPVPLGALVMCSTTTWTTLPVIVEPACVTLLTTITPR